MEQPKTYIAIIEVTFDAWDDENPRVIAREMASHFSDLRGANLYSDGLLKRLTKKGEEK